MPNPIKSQKFSNFVEIQIKKKKIHKYVIAQNKKQADHKYQQKKIVFYEASITLVIMAFKNF